MNKEIYKKDILETVDSLIKRILLLDNNDIEDILIHINKKFNNIKNKKYAK